MNDPLTDSTPDQQSSKNKSRLLLILKVAISFGLLGLVLYFVDFREAAETLANMNPWYLLAFIALVNVDRVLMAYKWNPLLRAFNIHVPFFQLAKIYLISPLAGLVLPSTIGGDVFRLYSLSRYKVNNQAVLASIIAERGIGLVAMLVPTAISVVAIIYLFREQLAQFDGLLITGLTGLGVVAATVWLVFGITGRNLDRIAQKLSKYPLIGKLVGVYQLFKEYRNHRGTLAKVFGWSVLEQMAPIVGHAILVMALGIDVSLWALVAIIPIIVLATRLPVSLDGIGVQEGLFVALFALAGVSAAEALLMSISSRIVIITSAVPWAIQYIISKQQPIPAPQQ